MELAAWRAAAWRAAADVPDILHGDNSCVSDRRPGGTNHTVGPPYDLHTVFAQDTLAHLNKTSAYRI